MREVSGDGENERPSLVAERPACLLICLSGLHEIIIGA